jgi:uncharacterized membrane protein
MRLCLSICFFISFILVVFISFSYRNLNIITEDFYEQFEYVIVGIVLVSIINFGFGLMSDEKKIIKSILAVFSKINVLIAHYSYNAYFNPY